MPDPTRFEYDNNELLELMLKDQGIHEGNWILSVKFQHTAANMGLLDDGTDASPTSLSMVKYVGIVNITEPLPFSVDASKVNPASSPKRKRTAGQNKATKKPSTK